MKLNIGALVAVCLSLLILAVASPAAADCSAGRCCACSYSPEGRECIEYPSTFDDGVLTYHTCYVTVEPPQGMIGPMQSYCVVGNPCVQVGEMLRVRPHLAPLGRPTYEVACSMAQRLAEWRATR